MILTTLAKLLLRVLLIARRALYDICLLSVSSEVSGLAHAVTFNL